MVAHWNGQRQRPRITLIIRVLVASAILIGTLSAIFIVASP